MRWSGFERSGVLLMLSCLACGPTSASSDDDDTSDGETGGTEGTEETDDESSGDDGEGEPEGEPPVAREDGPYAVVRGRLLEVDADEGVLDNDEDPEGEDLVVTTTVTVSQRGSMVAFEPDGSFTYEPPIGFQFGTDRFTYRILDEGGNTAYAEVRVVVQPAESRVLLAGLGSQGTRFVGIAQDDLAGGAVSEAGDFNGDGFADLVIGARYADPYGLTNTGEGYVVFGRPEVPPSFTLSADNVRLVGESAGDTIAHAIAGAGDVNGDGYSDIIVAGVGRSYIVFGGEELPRVLGIQDADVLLLGVADDASDHAVGAAGDINGDGFADVIVGADRTSRDDFEDVGESYVVFGSASMEDVVELEQADLRLQGREGGDRSGAAVSGVGDVNGDGYDDLVVGASRADPEDLVDAGETYLVFGGPDVVGVVGLVDADVRFIGRAEGDASGRAVAPAGDINGDGLGDLLVGATEADPNGEDAAGETYVLLGRSDFPATLSLADADVRIEGAAAFDAAGRSLGRAGDVDGDGYDDIVIGADGARPNGNSQTGESYVLFGGPSLPGVISSRDADLRLQGINAGDALGSGVAGAGDFNGDGFSDLLLGAIFADPGRVQSAGEAYLVFGDDLRARVSRLGHDTDETFLASDPDGADLLFGARGNDVLMADAGSDVLRGGQGNDVLWISNTDFLRADGGLGRDTLAFADEVNLDLTAMVSRVTEVEEIQLYDEGPSSLVLSEVTLLRLSAYSNRLDVVGDDDDTLTLLGGGWAEPEEDGGGLVYRSTSSAAVVRVSRAVAVSIPDAVPPSEEAPSPEEPAVE